MTLVARFFVSDIPVLISDALLSTPAPQNIGAIPLPSIRTSEKYHGDSPTTMAGVVQKMTLIEKNAVLCFAGEYALGREVLDYLKRLLKEGVHPATAWDRMRKHFSLNGHGGFELIFEAMHPMDDGYLELVSRSLGLREGKKNYRLLNEAVFAGTGAELAKRVVARGDHGTAPHVEGVYELAAQRGLHVVAELLDIDMRDGASFDKHCGGFYEIAIWYGNRFKKIDGVQFVYWTIEISDDDSSLRLDRILLQHYQDETLCVDEVLIDDSTPERVSLSSEQRLPISQVLHHRIPSLSQGYEAHEFQVSSRTPFQHKLTVHCCRLSAPDSFITTATIMSGKIHSPSDSDTVRVGESDVTLVKDIGKFLKDHLVASMALYDETHRQDARPESKSMAKRIKEFFMSV
jgi:hypothetical protein